MRFRFSLRTLLLAILLIGSALTLWQRWKPWMMVRVLRGDEHAVHSCVFSPDGHRLMTQTVPPFRVEPTSFGGERHPTILRIWDLEKPSVPPDMIPWGYEFDGGWRNYEFSADSRWLIAKFGERNCSRARVFDAVTGQDFFAPEDEVLDVCVPRGQLCLYAAYEKKPAEVWDLDNRRIVQTLTIPAASSILKGGHWQDVRQTEEKLDYFSARFSPDAKWVAMMQHGMYLVPAYGKEDQAVVIWPFVQNTKSGEVLTLEGELTKFDPFSPDGRTLMSYEYPFDCRLYDLSRRTLARRVEGVPFNHPFSPDGKSIVVSWAPDIFHSETGEYRIYDVDSGKLGPSFSCDEFSQSNYEGSVWNGTRLYFMRDLYTGSNSAILDLAAGTRVDIPGVIRPSPDGKRVFAFETDKERADVCDSNTGNVLAQLTGNTRVWSAAWSPDGASLVLGGLDGEAVLWKQHRPEQWWGVFLLPELWLTAVLSVACVFSIGRDRRAR